MSVFGFIENFFFISLAIVFALVVFLVYHFKNRISIAEKKSESMYGLLTAVVKEIKTLRGMFGLGGIESPVPSCPSIPSDPSGPFKEQTKIIPEVNVSVSSDESGVGRVNSTFSEYVAGLNTREVITLEISPSNNKIVVSDEEESLDDSSEDDSISSGESESDSDSELDLESEDANHIVQQQKEESIIERIDPYQFDRPFDLEVLSIQEPDNLAVPTLMSSEHSNEEIVPMELMVEEVAVVQPVSSGVVTLSEPEQEQVFQQIKNDHTLDEFEELEDSPENVPLQQSENVVDLSSVIPQIPPIEQLRKWNINQLKQIASQLGITADFSKMKKPELISLIREG